VKADIEKGEKKSLKFVQLHERENGGFLQLIGEDQVFNNLDCISVYEMKQY
jgi:hypothetical protein